MATMLEKEKACIALNSALLSAKCPLIQIQAFMNIVYSTQFIFDFIDL